MPMTPEQSLAKTANTAMIIDTAANVGGMAAQFIAGLNDAKQRAGFSQNLALLDNQQKGVLDQALLNANSETERLNIIKDVLTNLQLKRIDLLTANVAAEEKKVRTNTIIAASIMGVVGIGLLIFIAKSK